jgi:hypothetical protein
MSKWWAGSRRIAEDPAPLIRALSVDASAVDLFTWAQLEEAVVNQQRR